MSPKSVIRPGIMPNGLNSKTLTNRLNRFSDGNFLQANRKTGQEISLMDKLRCSRERSVACPFADKISIATILKSAMYHFGLWGCLRFKRACRSQIGRCLSLFSEVVHRPLF